MSQEPGMAQALDDLVDSLERRASALTDKARDAALRGDMREVHRLRGKAEGVLLAVSVIEDRIRGGQ